MKKQAIHTQEAPKAIGPYSQATVSGGLMFTSGQLGIDMATGQLAQGVEAQAHCAMKNIGAILRSQHTGYDAILKTTVFVTDMKDFAAVNQVYAQYFEGACPARSCVQVAALPLGGLVEIECVVAL